MPSPFAISATLSPLPDFPALGEGFAHVLASMYGASDSAHGAFPQEWRDFASLLHTLIEDEGMTCAEAARVAGVPALLVVDYADAIGL